MPRPSLFSALIYVGFVLFGARASAITIDWASEYRTPAHEFAQGLSVDGLGNVVVSGYERTGAGFGEPDQRNGFVAKFDSSGANLWSRKIVTDSNDFAWDVGADPAGNVYVAGETTGVLGEAHLGGSDAFLIKYDAAGNLQWTEQFGTEESELAWGVSADGLGNVFVVGDTYGAFAAEYLGYRDVFLRKYDSDGVHAWTRQIGTIGRDHGHSVAADGHGNVYIAGRAGHNFDGSTDFQSKAFLSKLDTDGDLLWTRLLDSANSEESYDVSTDGLGNVFVAGETWGDLDGPNAGRSDLFVAKYSSEGDLAWTRQFGTQYDDSTRGVSADGTGGVYLSGYTFHVPEEAFGGTEFLGSFVRRYDASGVFQWSQELSGQGLTTDAGVGVDATGSLYVGGSNYSGTGGNRVNALVIRLSDPVPEPTAAMLCSVLSVWTIVRARIARV